MAVDLDPPESFLDQFREGAKWTEPDGTLTSQARHFLESSFRFDSGAWEKLGGTEDFISDGSVREFYPWTPSKEDPATDLTSLFSEKQEKDSNISGLFSPPQRSQALEDITLEAGDTAFTTTASQVITCLNTAPADIFLNSTPEDGEEVIVPRREALVTINGAIDGDTSLVIVFKFDTPHLRFSAAAGEWGLI